MAEETKNTAVEETLDHASNQEATETTEKTFTQAEVDDLIKHRLAKAERSFDKKLKASLDEAEKLRAMNAEQKAEYEAQKKDDLIAELQAQITRNGLEKEATNMLVEAGIVANEAVLGFVVKENAEMTAEAVRAFSELVTELVNQKAADMIRGRSPKRVDSEKGTGLTKEDFHKLPYAAQLKVYQENPELFEAFTQ